MATPLSRRPEPDDGSPQAVPTGPAAAEYLLPATRRRIAAQGAATFGLLTGLWVAISPLFILLQHGGTNATFADLIAGLVTAAVGAVALVTGRAFGALQFASLVLGVWVLISSFILDAKFTIATPMFWSNTLSGVVLVLLALAGLATVRRAARLRTRAGPGLGRLGPHSSHRTENAGQEHAMGLNRRQEHELRVIEAGLCRSDPHLGGMFGMFGQLYPDPDMPAGEQMAASRERSRPARWLGAVRIAMATVLRRGRVRTPAAKPERTRDGGETGDQHDHSGPVG